MGHIKGSLQDTLTKLPNGDTHVLAKRLDLEFCSKERIQEATDALTGRARSAISRLETTEEFKVESGCMVTARSRDLMVMVFVTKTGEAI